MTYGCVCVHAHVVYLSTSSRSTQAPRGNVATSALSSSTETRITAPALFFTRHMIGSGGASRIERIPNVLPSQEVLPPDPLNPSNPVMGVACLLSYHATIADVRPRLPEPRAPSRLSARRGCVKERRSELLALKNGVEPRWRVSADRGERCQCQATSCCMLQSGALL